MRQLGWSLVVAMLAALLAGTAAAETVAYWRFDEGVAGSCVPKGFAMLDYSGNGNHLDVFTADCLTAEAGFMYRDEVSWPVVPQTGESNRLCIRTTGQWPSSTTNSSITNPSGIDAETITPAQWTVEATVKVEQYNTTWRCFVGRDSYGLSPNPMQSSFYLQVFPDNAVGVRFIDVSGYYHERISAPAMVEGYDPAVDPDGEQVPWYHLAAVSDGATLRLYLAEEGQPYELVFAHDLTASGSPDTSLAAGVGSHPAHGHEWHGGAWTVGRGLWDAFHNDRGRGFIDEVRISNSALAVHELLGYHRLAARNPVPADDAVNVPANVTFAWDVAANPSSPAEPHPQLVGHKLYLQVSGTDPTWAAPIDVPATGELTETYGPVALGTDLVGYRWRVDEVYHDPDPNIITGVEWTFDTMPSIPVITSQPSPAAQVVASGGDAAITIEVESISGVHYTWKRVVPEGEDVTVGTDSATLELTGVTEDAYYYCVVENDGGAALAVTSAQASVAVARQVAYWPLNGDYLDVSGEGHDADPNGIVSFMEGVDGTAEGAALVDASNGWATAGTWNPSEYSGEFTVSLWVYWDGPYAGWQSLIGKRDGGYNAAEAMWQISTGNNNHDVWFEGVPGFRAAALNVLVAGGWQHIAATFDGARGRLYYDGELQSDVAFQLGQPVDAVITLGASSGDLFDVGNQMEGALDDVRFYNYAMSQIEIGHLYNDITGESVCVQSERPSMQFDLDGNCIVDLLDFAAVAQHWLACGLVPDCIE